ncbi:MAG: sporulation protein YabP [Clostridia bacterium]|nr:sporulation protein YabP [Clostridia bacterium]
MEDRRKLSLTGVNDVECFDEQNVTVLTGYGELSVRGEGLKIGKLSTDTGDMCIEGKIDALIYSDDLPKQSGGFFSKVFR